MMLCAIGAFALTAVDVDVEAGGAPRRGLAQATAGNGDRGGLRDADEADGDPAFLSRGDRQRVGSTAGSPEQRP